MKLDDILTQATVIGAAGKMGSGISTLLALEMAKKKIANPGSTYRLNLIDVNEDALSGLLTYLKDQVTKNAERSIVALRKAYEARADLVENWEIIEACISDTMGMVRVGTDLGMAKNSRLVFEAVIENEDLKVKILKQLQGICQKDTVFLTNTSSIPIRYLDQQAELSGRIIGYHFYNPPIVQKLLEIITHDKTSPELKNIAEDLGRRLGKIIIPANDIAGFIGNGHFLRDCLYAISEAQRLQMKHSSAEAIALVNTVTQDLLVRPMGIYQLMDYVGIDVCQCILNVMRRHLKDDTLSSHWIDKMMQLGIKGGQNSDGSQKNGFFTYEKGKPAKVFDLEKGEYIGLDTIREKISQSLGAMPKDLPTWKNLSRDGEKDKKLAVYFQNLKTVKTPGAEMAVNYMKKSKAIGEKLVADQVAATAEDVNSVLKNGFFWLYGPINNYI